MNITTAATLVVSLAFAAPALAQSDSGMAASHDQMSSMPAHGAMASDHAMKHHKAMKKASKAKMDKMAAHDAMKSDAMASTPH